MEDVAKMTTAAMLISLIFAIALYVSISMFLNKFNKIIYGKSTMMAWLPVINIYLLGKLVLNKFFGWLLIICVFLTGTYTVTINNVEEVYTILPENIKCTFLKIFNIAVVVLFVCAIIKYIRLKKRGEMMEEVIQNSSKKKAYADQDMNQLSQNRYSNKNDNK